MSEAHNPLNLEEAEPESVLPPVGKIGGSIIELTKYLEKTSERPTPSCIFDSIEKVVAADPRKVKRLVGESSFLNKPNVMIDLIVYSQENSIKVDDYYSGKLARVHVSVFEHDDQGELTSSFESFGVEKAQDGSLCVMQYDYDEQTGQSETFDISGEVHKLEYLNNLLGIEPIHS